MFANPLHPYTQALLSAVPHPELSQPLSFTAINESAASEPAQWPFPFTLENQQPTDFIDLGKGSLCTSRRRMQTIRPGCLMYWLPRLFLLLAILPTGALLAMDNFIETPSLQARVDSGVLPPVAQRLPADALRVTLSGERSAGEHGGQMRMLMGKQKDIRQLVIYGYARLIGYTAELELKADLLKSYEVVDGRIFTLHLRKGHRWSDGHPFTSEDFRYYWEDVANNPELSSAGPPRALLVDGQLPQVEFPDAAYGALQLACAQPLFSDLAGECGTAVDI